MAKELMITMMWIATSAAVITGIIITKDVECLWGFAAPTLITAALYNKDIF